MTSYPEQCQISLPLPATSQTPQAPHIRAITTSPVRSVTEKLRSLPHEVVENIICLSEPPPKEFIDALWVLAHEDLLAGHSGFNSTYSRLTSAVKWPGVADAIRERMRLCPTCQKLRAKRPHAELLASTRSTRPFESVFIDFLGPLPRSGNYNYVLVCLDRFSHWIELTPTDSTSTDAAMKTIFYNWICRHGAMRLLTSDGGPPFTSEGVREMLDSLKVEHHISAAYHPEGHGAVEVAMYAIAQTLRAFSNTHAEWPELLGPVAFVLNTNPSRTLDGLTPFEVVHGYKATLPINLLISDEGAAIEPDSGDQLSFSSDLISRTAVIAARVRESQSKAYELYVKNYRAKAKGQTNFDIGSYVLVFFPRSQKLDLEWRGPYRVVQRESPLIYIVEDIVSGSSFRVHVNRMHIFLPGDLSPEQLNREACKLGEFLIEHVFEHEFRNGEAWFRVKWLGFDYNDDDAWVRYSDCRFSPVIKSYLRAHDLSLTVKGLLKKPNPNL